MYESLLFLNSESEQFIFAETCQFCQAPVYKGYARWHTLNNCDADVFISDQPIKNAGRFPMPDKITTPFTGP